MEATFAGALSSTISSMSSARVSEKLQQVGATEKQLDKMMKRFRHIQKIVEDVHKHNIEWGNNNSTSRVNRWLQEVNDLTNFVEDTIDEYESKKIRRSIRSSQKTSHFIVFPCQTSYRKVEKILSMLNKLQKEAPTTREGTMTSSYYNGRSGGSRLDRVPISGYVGRKIDEEKIVQSLITPRNMGDDIFTFAIVGMAGLGKTTLAYRVYINEKIRNEFQVKFWVTVGEVFDEKRILKEMLQSLDENIIDLNEETVITIGKKLLDFIRRKKTLIVLDDVWSVSQQQLSPLYELQDDGANFSILITTRRIEAAGFIVAPIIHHLERLSDDDSWHLFKSIARPNEEARELEAVGRKIVEKFHGVPLAIRKMAGILRDKEIEVSEWQKIAETELWNLPSFEILSTLSLTNDPVLSTLKRCFAYCFLFRKGAPIQKSDLIRLWLAQGFLSEEATAKSSFETAVAEKFFDILLNESLLLVSKKDEDGNIIDCTMHDLAHDLAMNISKHDVLIIRSHVSQPNLSDFRHLVIASENMEALLQVKTPLFRLRTIHSVVERVPETFLSQARYLYVLKLDGVGLEEVPKTIGKLKFLRYLDLSNNPIKYLPESITHLYLLQTLLLKNCECLLELPQGLYVLPNLTLIEVSPLQLASKTVASTAHREFRTVNLNTESEISELGSLTDIATLCINGLENVENKEAAKEAKIGSKNMLSALELWWKKERPEASDSQHSRDENVLDGLQPHSNIRRLKLVNYDSQQFPMWVTKMKGEDSERLHRLVKIELFDCQRCVQLPTMGRLLCLQELVFAGMNSIKTIGQEFYKYVDDDSEEKDQALEVFFPALRRLELQDFRSLKDWLPAPTSKRDGIHICRAFPSLEALKIVNCPRLTSIPTAFPRIKSLLIQGIRQRNWLDTIITNSCTKNSTLTSLVLRRMSNLSRLPNELFSCTSLEILTLRKCEGFNSWPPSPWNLSSLKELCIDDCSTLTSPPHVDENLTALKTLAIRGCKRLTRAPEKLGNCRSLTKLSISNCNLKTMPDLKELTSLEVLDILDCTKMKSLPAGLDRLTSLQTMRLGEVCDRFAHYPECGSFQKLEKLWLKGTTDTASLPQQLQLLPRLKVLKIWRFPGMEALPEWICDLRTLEKLMLDECDMLKQLPSRRRLLQLRRLRCLRIEKCPILEERYGNNGPLWNDIAHVLHTYINDQRIEGDRTLSLQESQGNNAQSAECSTVHSERDTVYDENYNEEGVDNNEDGLIWSNPKDGNQRRMYVMAFLLLSIVINSLHAYWNHCRSKQCWMDF